MSKAIVQSEAGGINKLQWCDWDHGEPSAGEVLIEHTVIGLNFIDTYIWTGAYPMMKFSGVLGMEAVGVVRQFGEGVDGLVLG
jgi:NADPH2:quinone reductase